MFGGKTVFGQLMEIVDWRGFQKIVDRYGGDVKIRTLKTHQFFRIMAFAQLTHRRSLRDTVTTLRAMKPKWFHMGITAVSRNNLSNASQQRDWRNFRRTRAGFVGLGDETLCQNAVETEVANEGFRGGKVPLPMRAAARMMLPASRC